VSNEIKSFVIDTNVFIHKPDAILSFRDNEVVVPMWVLEELDKLKTYSDEKGRNAREAIRFLDALGKQGSLAEGVKMKNGSTLRVTFGITKNPPADMQLDRVDNMILLSALQLKEEGRNVFFVSKDINARVKAKALGLYAVDYEKQKVIIEELYSGTRHVDLSKDKINDLLSKGEIDFGDTMLPNQYAFFDDDRFLARYQPAEGKLKYIMEFLQPICGIRALNLEQLAALDILLDPEISLVTLVGKAGTGKTLLALAAGLKMILEDTIYTKMLVSRPVIPMGKDIGYLPGAKGEKLAHWMQPLFDNLEYILNVYKKQHIKSVDSLVSHNQLEVEALTYIRGRSLPNQYIIIDEAQNLSPHEIKTIVSRAGEGTKVVLTGDPYQIDNPYLDSSSNGLTFLVETFKNQEIYGHVTLHKSERSKLAELAAELL
jgi:PhoH-like ATPase